MSVTGKQITVNDIARNLITLSNAKMNPEIVNKYRKGDIRHCYSDITKIKKHGFKRL